MKARKILLILMVMTLIIMSGCSDDPTKPTIALPTVTNVEVTPSNAVIVLPGDTQQFNATVIGTNNPPQTVLWAVIAIPNMGELSEGTGITQGGLLTVAEDETAILFTVTASSVLDPTQTGIVAVSTTNVLPPAVSSVEVYPEGAELAPGEQQQFEAYVYGEEGVLQEVIWSVAGGVTGTGITQSGLLTVSNNEPAFKILTVRAAYFMDSSKYGEATVMVMPGSMENVVNWVYLSNVNWYGEGQLAGIMVNVERPTPITDVTVRVNNTDCVYGESETGYDDEDGLYWYDGYFAYTPSLFVAGTSYSVTVSVNGTSFSGSVVMVHTPNVTSPASFNEAQSATFSWTMGSNPMVQFLYIGGYLFDWGWYEIADGPINPSIRSYTIPADTVPLDWQNLEFDLGVMNVSLTNNTMIGSQMEYWKEYYNGYYNGSFGAKSSGKPDRDAWKKKRGMIKEYLK